MGAAESANRSQEEEEEERGRRGERLNAGGAAAAAMGAVAVGTAAVGIYKMLSSNTNTVEVKHEGESMMVGATSSREGQRGTTINSTWAPPPLGRLKMNTDATCRPHAQAQLMGMVSHDDSVMQGPSGYGGILRDDRGTWIIGFRGYIGVTDCLTAEFKAIFSGLKLLDKYGYTGAILESDSDQAVGWIQRDDTEYRRNSRIIGPLWPEIKECKHLVDKNRITIKSCSRDANKCADKLADMGLALEKQLINHEGRCEEILIIPFEVQQIVDEEERGLGRDNFNSGSVAAAAMGAVAVGTAAVAIYKMLSNNTNTVEEMMVGNGPSTRMTMITWSPPPPGRFKMNTDGACRPHAQSQLTGTVSHDDSVMRGPSGYGGILRDHRGNWIRGFQGYIGVTDCLTAEFKGILAGLKLLDEYGYTGAILESDCDQAVDWIQKDDADLEYYGNSRIIGPLWSEIKECKRLVTKNEITIRSCSRDANKCAHKLANTGIHKQEPYKEITNMPYEMEGIV